MLSQAITQAHLEQVVNEIFKREHIVVNARKKGEVKNPHTGYFLELDIWIPELHLAFEFQDAYHYATTWYNQNSLVDIKGKDQKKSEYVAKRNITLVHVPCWWDASIESLVATIIFLRPDVLLERETAGDPIPPNPPFKFFSAFSVPDVGEMMLASFAESHEKFAETISSVSPWWLGEKYDGLRCIWNPKAKKLYNKTGLELSLPTQLDALCGNSGVFMDGEIWAGRGLYVDALKILGAIDIKWAFLRMSVFDNPGPSSQILPFEKRYASLLQSIYCESPFLIIVTRISCKSNLFLKKSLQQIIEGGGEGVILRKPKSFYERGRSDDLVKMKAARGDTEALVLSTSDIYFTLQMPNGVTFDVEYANSHVLPKKGDIVTLEYESYSRKSAPVNPTIVRIRTDLRWEDVVADFVISDPQRNAKNYVTKPKGYWTDESGKNLRNFFEEFAKSKNLDPLLAETWYSISGSFVTEQRDTTAALSQKGGYIKALMQVFPDIGIDEKMFPKVPAGFWEDTQNRKDFFVSFAAGHQFDPLVPENWYKARELKELEEGSSGILQYYQGSVIKALLHLFPDIGIEENKFSHLPKGYWSNFENRKKFFDDFGREQGFDPLVPQNWYSITWRIIKNAKGKSLLEYYTGQSVIAALLDIYPDIDFDRSKFSLPNKYWEDPLKRKNFFDQFASENGFDPLVPENWYSVSSNELRETKSYSSVVQYYKGGIVAALMDLYPNIGLENHKFLQKRKEKFTLGELNVVES
eukprot:Phypoly_transcript_01978.p1 GENE.Phypoly_transcript_01978~~Phypoly_transcript_01978.p1  ORF type:complete len:752 (+),score=127.08 Phypoly_transcript_01978:45-2300(+)